MIAYFVIFALCGVIVVQTVIYYRERLKLYDIIRAAKTDYKVRDAPPKYDRRHKAGHKWAMLKWRNGGDYK